jgi:hypothetical protein
MVRVDRNINILEYAHYSKLDINSTIPTVATILLGILTIIVGFYPLNQYFDFVILDSSTYAFTRLVFAVIVLIFSFIALYKRTITEGILLLLSGVSSLIFVLSEISLGIAGFSITYLFFTIAFLICAGIFLSRHQYLSGTASLIMSASIIIAVFVPDDIYDMVFGTGMMVSGSIFLTSGIKNLFTAGLDIDPKYRNCPIDGCSDGEYPHILVSTADILSFAMLSLVLGYYVLDTTGQSQQLYIVKILLSTIVMFFGVYAMGKGILDEGLMMFTVALSTFIFAVTHLLHVGGPIQFDLIMSFIMLAIAIEFAYKKDILMTLHRYFCSLYLLWNHSRISKEYWNWRHWQ